MTQTGQDELSRSEYRVLARKYRPKNFEELVGQEPMVRTLSNAFGTGRIAQAYILSGVRGVGKTTTARILARALNFRTPDTDRPSIDLPGLGEHCQSIMDGNHLDIIEMDAASHTGIDDIRDLIESSQYKPVSARYKVYIIDEVHMLSRSAFNGLLKTLEEPPEHLKFIFATTEIRKVPVTILSRCQRFDLRRITSDTMIESLKSIAEKESVKIDSAALSMITRASEGSMRDALSLMDQAISHSVEDPHSTVSIKGDSVREMLGLADQASIINLFEYVMRGNVSACLDELHQQYDAGVEPVVALGDLANFVHFVTRLKYAPQAAEDSAISETEGKKGAEFASSLSVRVLGRAWQILLKGIEETTAAQNPLAAADMTLVRLAHAATLPTPDEIIRSIEQRRESTQSATAGTSETSLQQGPSTVSARTSRVTTEPAVTTQVYSAIPMTGRSNMQMPLITSREYPIQNTPGKNPVTLDQFEDLILLAGKKRDLQIKTCLRRNLRMVSFEDGRMEFSITGNPPPTFISNLQEKIKLWTGKRWNLVISREQGNPSLEEAEQAETKNRMDSALSDPAIAAILTRFPGARVIDARMRHKEKSKPDIGDNADNLEGSPK